ncbi:MAG: cell division protein SepF [Trebonia sp.]
MASAMRKMAVYLGLVEDDRRYAENYEAYDEYDDYDESADAVEPATPAPAPPPSPAPSRADYAGYPTDHRIETVPPQQVELARITTLHPRTYNEARNIGEHFRDGTPVIMNLTEMVDSDARRLVDFAAGLIFGLRGSIDKVTNKVFLLSPANVEVTAEDKARIAERGFFNQS